MADSAERIAPEDVAEGREEDNVEPGIRMLDDDVESPERRTGRSGDLSAC